MDDFIACARNIKLLINKPSVIPVMVFNNPVSFKTKYSYNIKMKVWICSILLFYYVFDLASTQPCMLADVPLQKDLDEERVIFF